MIRLFSEKDIDKPSVIQLWQECFGDSKEYIKFFLDNCPAYTCICYLNSQNAIVSMLFLLDGFLNSKKCKYLYAACTALNYRGQGIMEKLIEFSKSFAYEHGASGIFLVPANERLYRYYSKFGFIDSFRKKEYITSASNGNSIITNCNYDIETIVELKRELCSDIDAFSFDDSIVKYTIQEHLFNGGHIYANLQNKNLIFYFENENEVRIKEILIKSGCINDVINEVFVNISGKNIYFFSPIVYNNSDMVGNYTKCGMCFPLDEEMITYLDHNRDIYAGMYLD